MTTEKSTQPSADELRSHNDRDVQRRDIGEVELYLQATESIRSPCSVQHEPSRLPVIPEHRQPTQRIISQLWGVYKSKQTNLRDICLGDPERHISTIPFDFYCSLWLFMQRAMYKQYVNGNMIKQTTPLIFDHNFSNMKILL